jgi:hypothetical protein
MFRILWRLGIVWPEDADLELQLIFAAGLATRGKVTKGSPVGCFICTVRGALKDS